MSNSGISHIVASTMMMAGAATIPALTQEAPEVLLTADSSGFFYAVFH